ncbi:hypothetical protein D3C74_131620 [compost metagenome]
MNFKDQLAADVKNVFMNANEFAELHWWYPDAENRSNGYQIEMIVELFTLDGKPVSHAEGVSTNNAVVHVDLQSLGYVPTYGQQIFLDNYFYVVDGVDNTFGMLKITLKRPHTP